SGHRFSDAVTSSKWDTPLGAGTPALKPAPKGGRLTRIAVCLKAYLGTKLTLTIVGYAPANVPWRTAMRTAATAPTIRIIRTRAPAHACLCHSSKGEMAYVKICSDKAAVGWSVFQFQNWFPNAVNNRGAVSPATRAKASMTPVMTPEA